MGECKQVWCVLALPESSPTVCGGLSPLSAAEQHGRVGKSAGRRVNLPVLRMTKRQPQGQEGCRLFQQAGLCICTGFIPSASLCTPQKFPPLGFLYQSWFSLLGGQGVSQLRVTSLEKLPLTPSTHVSHSLTPFQALQLGQHPRCSPWTKRDMSKLLLQRAGWEHVSSCRQRSGV